MCKTLYLILLFALATFFIGCRRDSSANIIGEKKMENILYERQLAEAITETGDNAAYRQRVYIESIYSKYGVTEAQFDSSLLWYARHTDRLYKIYENIDKHLTDEAQLLGLENNATSTYASMGTKGDTANIWNGRSYYLLTSQGVGNNYMTFRIEADTTFYRDDRFLLHFVSHFVYSDGPRDAVVSLSVVYNNDSVGSMVSHLITDGDFTTMIRSTDRPIKAVEGFIYLNTKWSDRPRLLFVTNPSLIRFHETKEDREEIRRLDSIRKASKHLMIDTLKADTAERTPLKTNGQLLLRKKPIPHRTFRKEPLL